MSEELSPSNRLEDISHEIYHKSNREYFNSPLTHEHALQYLLLEVDTLRAKVTKLEEQLSQINIPSRCGIF